MVGALRPNGSRVGVFGVALGVVVTMLLVLGASARAAGEYELNDTRETAYGPLEGGKKYTATIETNNDVDWYVFYIRTYSQMDFSVERLSDGYGATVYLADKDGELFRSFGTGSLGEANHLKTTLDPGRYYFRVTGSLGARYSFQIEPAAAITANRECGEAIVGKEIAVPELTKANEQLAKVEQTYAAASAPISSANAKLTALTQEWQVAKKHWKKRQRRIQRHRIAWFKTRAGRKLISEKRQVNRRNSNIRERLLDKIKAAEPKLSEASGERTNLQNLVGQFTNTVNQADQQIAAHCG